MICFILVALFVLFFVWGGAFIEGRHSFENTYFKGALITKYLLQGGRSFEGGALSRKYGTQLYIFDKRLVCRLQRLQEKIHSDFFPFQKM